MHWWWRVAISMLMMLEANSSYKEGDRTSWWCHIYSLSAVSALTYIGPRVFSLGLNNPPLFLILLQAKGAGNLRCDPAGSSWNYTAGQICKDNMTQANGHSHAILSNSVVQICIMFTLENIHNSHQPLFKVHWFFFCWTASLEELLLNVKHLS